MLDPARRAQLGELGLNEVRARFGLTTAAETLERIYLTSLEDTRDAASRRVEAAAMLLRQGAHLTKRRVRRARARA
jgi:hypothetical protein